MLCWKKFFIKTLLLLEKISLNKIKPSLPRVSLSASHAGPEFLCFFLDFSMPFAGLRSKTSDQVTYAEGSINPNCSWINILTWLNSFSSVQCGRAWNYPDQSIAFLRQERIPLRRVFHP